MFKPTSIALAVSAVLLPASVFADQPDSSTEKSYERIIVTASPLEKTALETAQPVYVLYGDELRKSEAATLGETLRNLPGVQATYFSPTASSPIIRGLEGPRVKIVQNGLDVADISRGGPDHAVSTEASTAQQIEVLRGPATLLFGSGASGGVVNVVDNRIPRAPIDGIEGAYSLRYNSVSEERTGSFDINAGNGRFAWHLDGFKRKANDYRVPRFAQGADDDHHDHDHGHSHDHGHEDHSDLDYAKRIDNSFTDDQGATIGASVFFDNGFAGISFGRLERDYGLPGHSHGHGDDHDDDHGHDSEHSDHDEIFARMRQDRFQFISGLVNPIRGIERLDITFGYTELSHEEIEDGFVETAFSVEQTELRLIARHAPIAGWRGALGLQVSHQDYDSFGAEAYTPHTETDLAGIFWIGEQQISDAMSWELGARVETVDIHSHGFADLSYTPTSISSGLNWQVASSLKLSSSISYSERAPHANELFSNGPHFATRTYEVGGVYHIEHNDHYHDDHGHDHDHGHDEYHYVLDVADRALEKERSMNLDFGMHFEGTKWHLDTNIFFNRINNFIYLHNTGILKADLGTDMFHDDHGHDHGHAHNFDDLPVYQYRQRGAELYGYEISGRYVFNESWAINGFSDYTRAVFRDGGNVPRIPAQRVGLSGTYTQDQWDATLNYVHYFDQNRTADNEQATSGFGLLGLSMNYYPGYMGGQDFAIYFKVDNITNELGYAHSSFIRDYAPLPGRNFGIGFRASF